MPSGMSGFLCCSYREENGVHVLGFMLIVSGSLFQVGGGMGRTHRVETTFPRLAEPLGYVPKEDILYAIKAIVVTQRDHGRRDDRRYSRMKYLISSWGIEKFRTVVEQYYGRAFEPFRDLPEWEFKSYLGWHEQVNSMIRKAMGCICLLIML